MKFCKTSISSILNSCLRKNSPIFYFKVWDLHIWQIIFELVIFWCPVIVFIQSLPDFFVEGGAKVWITLYFGDKDHLARYFLTPYKAPCRSTLSKTPPCRKSRLNLSPQANICPLKITTPIISFSKNQSTNKILPEPQLIIILPSSSPIFPFQAPQKWCLVLPAHINIFDFGNKNFISVFLLFLYLFLSRGFLFE